MSESVNLNNSFYCEVVVPGGEKAVHEEQCLELQGRVINLKD